MRRKGDSSSTRWSLIERLKNWDDNTSWEKFFETYWRLIYRTGIRSGLSEDEAQEVVQETVISVAKKMRDFKADPAFTAAKPSSDRGWNNKRNLVVGVRPMVPLRPRLGGCGCEQRVHTPKARNKVKGFPEKSDAPE